MILCYHKVHPEIKSYWYVSVDKFNRDMAALQAYDVVYLDDYDAKNPRHAVITFDGIYDNVAEYALPILKKWNYPFELFVVGDTVGQDNGFDQHVEPPCNFASIDQLKLLAANRGRVQWHTASHKRLQNLSDEDLDRELTPSAELRAAFPSPHLDWFAYPHGDFDQSAVDGVAKRFKGALACDVGNDDDRHRLTRLLLAEKHDLFKTRTLLAVYNRNSGHRLIECLDSIFKQTIAPDEVFIIDDASTDASQTLLYLYADRVRIIRNEEQIGPAQSVSKTLQLTSSEYVAFVDARDRLRSDFIEHMRSALDRSPHASAAHSDFVLFGDRASAIAEEIGAKPIGRSARAGSAIFVCNRPDLEADLPSELKSHLPLDAFIFRREAWESQVSVGSKVVRVPHPLIECGIFTRDGLETPALLEQTALEWKKGFIASQIRNDKLSSDLSETSAFAAKLHRDIHELKDAIVKLKGANADLRRSQQDLKSKLDKARTKKAKEPPKQPKPQPSLLRRIRSAAARLVR
ncbi:glycosyltransferase involved in cell wall biosynthesis/peptidoglycan/xylan/chitin deacetylase (PgdA/CDA1 family) [Microvirga flocculans]|uniref:Chitooligosaccharide deacetylase n=1 Tax=Microvirga flocculans TaxID=217168 RepID=A0A7W6IDP6_9HYPH|nr:glycosyltransferase [Microvirga flocculans]MBB4039577.1 glycosyltransferase involved in cell wall biosynthesis/peptidoglycan/xylan/chitin deacetylase (PgdA/CDA1 family) [Microvirga flocculans]